MRARLLTAALTLAVLALLSAPAAHAAPPDWPAPNPSLYEGSLGVTSVLVVNGQERTAAGDRMAAFIGSELRGVAQPIVVGGRNLYFLTVYGNAADVGAAVTFRAYDATTDATLNAGLQTGTGTATSLTFAFNSQSGTVTNPYRVAADVFTGTEGTAPTGLRLEAPAPNPATSATSLRFSLPATGTATLAVYDALGRQVAVLADGTLSAGLHEAALDAARLAPGLYTVRLATSAGIAVQRLAVAR